mmetsp:Transcript_30885/g.82792  ORF Transcript_30885/g.82792 Transcript_30885/m.82792 type:complete len:662 (+) Transcript_30885:412-2397(+)
MYPSQGRCSSTSVRLEQSCILFNAGSLWAQYADREFNRSPESPKDAARGFKRAATLFAMARAASAQVSSGLSTDISDDCLHMLESMCLGHAQRCFYETSTRQSSAKNKLQAKLSTAVADFYGYACTLGGNPTSDLGKFFAGWEKGLFIGALTVEMHYFRALSQIHIAKSLDEEKAMKKGEEVAYLSTAMRNLEQGAQVAKKHKLAGRADDIARHLQQAKLLLDSAEQDNRIVYHQPLPPSLPIIEPLSMVKLEWLPDQPEPDPAAEMAAAGGDPFGTLVSAAIHRGALAFAAKRQDLVNAVNEAVQTHTTQARARLVAQTPQLDALASAEAPRVPQRLRDRIVATQAVNGVRGLMQRAEECLNLRTTVRELHREAVSILDAEEAEDRKLRAQFEARWTPSVSSTINEPLRKELAAHDSHLTLASQSDDRVQARLAEARSLLDRIALPLVQLDSMVAGADDPAYQAGAAAANMPSARVKDMAAKMRGLVESTEKLFGQRETERLAFLTRVQEQDPVQALLAQVQITKATESAIAALLAEFNGTRQSLMQLQEQIDAALLGVEAAGKELQSVATSNEELRRRESLLSDLSKAVDVYEDLDRHSKEGLVFYTARMEQIRRLKERASDLKVARDVERRDVLDNIAAQAHAARALAVPDASGALPI